MRTKPSLFHHTLAAIALLLTVAAPANCSSLVARHLATIEKLQIIVSVPQREPISGVSPQEMVDKITAHISSKIQKADISIVANAPTHLLIDITKSSPLSASDNTYAVLV